MRGEPNTRAEHINRMRLLVNLGVRSMGSLTLTDSELKLPQVP